MWTCKKCGEQIEDQFDSCWKCSGTADEIKKPAPQPLKWSDYLLTAVMSYALPWLVIFLSYLIRPSVRTVLYRICDKTDAPEVWIELLIPAAITFLVLCPFLKYRAASWLVYALAGICWLSLIW
jgi:hypothetical protein